MSSFGIKQGAIKIMQAESSQLEAGDCWTKVGKGGSREVKRDFLALNQDFQFMVTSTLSLQSNLLVMHGELVFNNGLPVPLSSSHQLLFANRLNVPSKTSRVVFAIDQGPQTLTFSVKVNMVESTATADRWLCEVEEEVLSKKKAIIALLAVTGVQMDCENQVMRQMLKHKKNLKRSLQVFLHDKKIDEQTSSQPQHSEQTKQQQFKPESPQVIEFGKGTPNSIQLIEETSEVPQPKIKKTVYEGGYFTIQNFYYKVCLGDSEPVIRNLCKKTLREKKRLDQRTRRVNQQKMMKELEIVSSVREKEHLIRYYVERTEGSSPEYVLMDQYDYSLQEYIYFYGDSLEAMQKISIAKQLVSAVISLHRSGVVHRDLKPSNILIKDEFDRNGEAYRIKVIDFGESYSSRIRSHYEHDYGCSHPYSPLECGMRKGVNQQGVVEGVENKEIDYWSVGMNIFQVFFRKLPLSYSRPFQTDIVATWKTELMVVVNQRQKYGVPLVEDIITIVCLRLIKYSQQKRMRLELVRSILSILEEYLQAILSLAQQPRSF